MNLILSITLSIILSLMAYIGYFFFIMTSYSDKAFGSGIPIPLYNRIVSGIITSGFISLCLFLIFTLSGPIFLGVVTFGMPLAYILYLENMLYR